MAELDGVSPEGFKDLSALMAVGSDRTVSAFKRLNVALTRRRLLAHPATFADHSSLRYLSGHRLRISYPASPLAHKSYLTSCFEQIAIAQHDIHDDGKTTRQRHTCLSQSTTLGDLHYPTLEPPRFRMKIELAAP